VIVLTPACTQICNHPDLLLLKRESERVAAVQQAKRHKRDRAQDGDARRASSIARDSDRVFNDDNDNDDDDGDDVITSALPADYGAPERSAKLKVLAKVGVWLSDGYTV
jgi:hypothetical protein